MKREVEKLELGRVDIPEGWERTMRYVTNEGVVMAVKHKPLTEEQIQQREQLVLAKRQAKVDSWSKEGAKYGLPPVENGESLVDYRKKVGAVRRSKLAEQKLKDQELRNKERQAKAKAKAESLLKKLQEREAKLQQKREELLKLTGQ